MTLIELLVAMMISVITFTIGYAAFSTLVDQRNRVVTITDATTKAILIRRSLVGWLEGAHMAIDDSAPTLIGVDHLRGNTPDDEITFLTNSATPLDEEETVVRLYIQRGSSPERSGLAMEAKAWKGNRATRMMLDHTVTGMKIEYLAEIRQQRHWISHWSSSAEMPEGIRVTLFPDENDSLTPLLRLPIVLRFDQLR